MEALELQPQDPTPTAGEAVAAVTQAESKRSVSTGSETPLGIWPGPAQSLMDLILYYVLVAQEVGSGSSCSTASFGPLPGANHNCQRAMKLDLVCSGLRDSPPWGVPVHFWVAFG